MVHGQTPTFRVLVGTPCGGGQLSVQYMLSMFAVFRYIQDIKHKLFVRDNLRKAALAGMINEENTRLLQQLESEPMINLEVGIYTIANESLLSRGRNHIAAVAMRGGWDKLFFIDADASFTVNDFMSVVTSPHHLCAGTCPLKILPISLNYLPLKEDQFYHRDAIRSMESLNMLKEGHKQQFIPVAFIGTAFMCISRELLLKAAEISTEYQYPNPATGHMHTHWNMFATDTHDGKFMSEDWWFCHLARKLGYKVMMDSNVVISHVGNFTFHAGLASIKQQSATEIRSDSTSNSQQN